MANVLPVLMMSLAWQLAFEHLCRRNDANHDSQWIASPWSAADLATGS